MTSSGLALTKPVHSPRSRSGSHKLISILLGVLAGLLLSEAILRIVLAPQDRFFVWPPYYKAMFRPNPALLPGVTGDAWFTTNSWGIRGGEFAHEQKYRILAVGGSTTECLLLDDTETWAYLLEKKLSESKQWPVWVGNIGRSGRNTRDHILQMKHLLPQLPRIDAVLLLAGVNDLHIRISDMQYDPFSTSKPTFEEEYTRRAFETVPYQKPLYHYTRLGWWRMAKRFKAAYLTDLTDAPVVDLEGEAYAKWRYHRKHAEEIVDTVPDLTASLQEYRRNLETIADIAQRAGARLILVTQPTIWRSDLSQEEMDILWLGGIGSFQLGKGHKYYSPAALDHAMHRYNGTLLDVCRQRGIDCIDLAGALPKDRTVFYDDVHFNESGARRIAEELFKFIDARILSH